jgi:hypothetical protein
VAAIVRLQKVVLKLAQASYQSVNRASSPSRFHDYRYRDGFTLRAAADLLE